ncbi:DUF3826 domain-containing protein [Dysgonomonas termitidis]|uniref:DUF3826 domain-containing protein n=1 Tax=Dysgonomonas termitidis TaxID=1516126 RepID=A0ABV9L144_9BACT
MMKKLVISLLFVFVFTYVSAQADTEILKKSTDWVTSLELNDKGKEARLADVISTHLTAVKTWHDSHSYTMVPEGINPKTGEKLSADDRQLIVDSTIPKTVHEALMTGLRKDLTEEQVEAILDKYTIGKVDFTMKAYREILPDMPKEMDEYILNHLKQAREEAVDYKSMREISAIFKIHKTRIELYLYQNNYNWKAIYKEYVDSLKKK